MKYFLVFLVWLIVQEFTIRGVSDQQPKNMRKCISCSVENAIGNFFKEIYFLHRALFTLETVKIATAFTPWFLTTKIGEEKIHTHFYDAGFHKNIYQLPGFCIRSVEEIAFWGCIGLASFALWAPYTHVRRTGRLFTIGVISGLFFKDFVKICKTNSNLRPWNEKFSCKKRSYGGFPSGHMFEATYMAMVFGLEYGIRAWVPLGAFATCMFVVSINANRHYISQVIAGVGLGVIYGVATHKAIQRSKDELFSVRPCFEKKIKGVSVSCAF